MGRSVNEFKDLDFNNQLPCIMQLLGLKTKEDLIRYIVCEGEPADESCVGHPVMFKNFTSVGFPFELILKDIHRDDGDIFLYESKSGFYYHFAKKKAGYDYNGE